MDDDLRGLRGHEALAAGRWADARDAFESSLCADDGPLVLRGLAEALWWLADARSAAGHMERAYGLLRQAGAVEEAVMTAVWLAGVHQRSLGSSAAADSWVARAASLLDGAGAAVAGALHGWVALARSDVSSVPSERRMQARRALEVARRVGDTDLELCALATLGSALVASGEVDEGLAHVDEAMSALQAGGPHSPGTFVAATCSLLVACDLAADLDRITQSCRVSDRFLRDYGSPFLYADCRVRYGSVLVATGRWEEADRELHLAVRTAPADTAYHARAVVTLALLRCRQGRLDEAEALLDGLAEQAQARPVLAVISASRGDAALAAMLVSRHLGTAQLDAVELAEGLGTLVETAVAAADLASAEEAVGRLANLPAAQGSDRVAGHAALARSRLALARGRVGDATASAREAVRRFDVAALPFDRARAQRALAQVLAEQQRGLAVVEAQSAFATFERLGADSDADLTAALLSDLDVPARTGRRPSGRPTVPTSRTSSRP